MIKSLKKIKYGDEANAVEFGYPNNCGDCNVVAGGYHIDGCDVERCVTCGGQVISCYCDDTK